MILLINVNIESSIFKIYSIRSPVLTSDRFLKTSAIQVKKPNMDTTYVVYNITRHNKYTTHNVFNRLLDGLKSMSKPKCSVSKYRHS